MRGKALSPEQNEHLRVLVKQLLERFTQQELADLVGLTQASISGFLSGRVGTSMNMAKRVAELMGRTLDDVLALRDPGEPDRYPKRAVAARFARAVGAEEYLPEAIDFVEAMERVGGDLTVKKWLEMIDFWDGQLRLGHLLPLGPQGRRR